MKNFVYQDLCFTREGRDWINIYDFEKVPENKQMLLDTRQRTYFNFSRVASLIVYAEISRTNSYEYYTFFKIHLCNSIAKNAFFRILFTAQKAFLDIRVR